MNKLLFKGILRITQIGNFELEEKRKKKLAYISHQSRVLTP